MEKTLLWEAFAALTNAEVREFGKFVRSPFFNARRQPVLLFEYLDACRRAGRLPKEEEVAEVLNKEEGGLKMRQANSALLALLEHYLAWRELAQEVGKRDIRLTEAYRKRNLPKHFTIALREAKQRREKQEWRDAEYFHELNLLEWEQYQFDTATRRTETFNLQANSDWMDTAFMARKLRLGCLAAAHQTVYRTQYRMGLLPVLLQYLEADSEGQQLLEWPAVALYYHGYCFQTQPEQAEQHFQAYRNLLSLHARQFPPDELRTLYLLAINFGIKKTNELRAGWPQATLDLYRGALELGLLLENGRMSRFAFNNIIAVALRVGELDWVERFILDHKQLLERQWREVAASLGLARVAYARKDYRTALLHLQRSDYKDLINNLTAKTLQLKIYYETDEFELLKSHLASMRTYIRRHTSIGYQRTNYSKIVQYTGQLMALDFRKADMVAKLREAVQAEEILTEKEWFLEQIGG
ncbi:MAG: hypothetical protein JNN28_15965 [Saprospiraceae bacterium]|nr:hypothetical protein [Saprospiraceae bacterium]